MLAAEYFTVQVAQAGARWLRTRPLRIALTALLVAALLAQGLIYSVHSGLVLARADTRNLTRAWMLAHIPAGAGIVAEPVEPQEWARERAETPASERRFQRLASFADLPGWLAGR